MKSAYPFLNAVGILWVWAALGTRAAVFYVDVNNPSPSWPYTNWASAAGAIQDAVNAASNGDQVLVNDGVYDSGGAVVTGSLLNRVVIAKAISVLLSPRGPGFSAAGRG